MRVLEASGSEHAQGTSKTEFKAAAKREGSCTRMSRFETNVNVQKFAAYFNLAQKRARMGHSAI